MKSTADEQSWFERHIPGFALISATFDAWLRLPISFSFHVIGLDHYSKVSKLSLFFVLVLLPTLLILIKHGVEFLLDIIDPAPQLVKIAQQNQPTNEPKSVGAANPQKTH